MALETAAILYPRNSTTVDTAAGIDIRVLAASNTSSAEAQSVTNSSQGTTSERTFDPANTGVTAVANANSFQGEGWALRLAEDNTPVDDTNCNAVLTAGTLVVNLSGASVSTGSLNIGASHSLTPRASLWRYNVSTNTATLIASGTGTAVTTTATASTPFTASVSINIPNTVEFQANEVLFLQIGGLVGAGAGLLGGATSVTWTLNTNINGTNLDFATGQGIAQVCFFTGSSAGIGSASGAMAPVYPTTGSASGVGSASGDASAYMLGTGASAGVGSAAGTGGAVKLGSGSASGVATASGTPAIVKPTVGEVNVAGGSTPEPEIVNPDYVLTTQGQLHLKVADTEPYALYQGL